MIILKSPSCCSPGKGGWPGWKQGDHGGGYWSSPAEAWWLFGPEWVGRWQMRRAAAWIFCEGRTNRTECKASPILTPGLQRHLTPCPWSPSKGTWALLPLLPASKFLLKQISPLWGGGRHIHGIPSTPLLWTCVFWVLVGFCLFIRFFFFSWT